MLGGFNPLVFCVRRGRASPLLSPFGFEALPVGATVPLFLGLKVRYDGCCIFLCPKVPILEVGLLKNTEVRVAQGLVVCIDQKTRSR